MNPLQQLDFSIRKYRELLNTNPPPENGWYPEIENIRCEIGRAFIESIGLGGEPECLASRPSQLKTKHLRDGFVYCMKNARNGLFKIGWSQNPKFREKTLQSEEPEIILVGFLRGTMAVEKALHIRFSVSRVRGEWFKLDVDEIKSVFAEGCV